ncbi:hypothetical protein CCACVL1_01023 [Corchorus capsularis]|uniref:Uncharacterized protein n=1 Tax=Corchorus capsularis TaxID=210143 RepID=A0A1R3KSC9_COCAP|nr:hypothetical protein CCACVL1_02304 [Corchorus capsularis]OMP09981.1 hypothetical protein CCACVL1_01023 [Corchorus capsularis]
MAENSTRAAKILNLSRVEEST